MVSKGLMGACFLWQATPTPLVLAGLVPWHTIYTRMNRWAKAGVPDKLFEKMQEEQIVRIKIETVSLDSTIVKVHPDGTGALKKGPQAIGNRIARKA
jgi:hypothetical protein